MAHRPELPPGTDLTAVIWKTLQSTQIQTQLDQSHNLYDIEKLQTKDDTSSKSRYYFDNYGFKIANIDDELQKIKGATIRKSKIMKKAKKKKNTSLENLYLPKIRTIYNEIYKSVSSDKNNIKDIIIEELLETPNFNTDNQKSMVDSTWLANLGNYIDIRKNKTWVSYILSDFIPRQGVIYPHPIYNNIPGWLFDAMKISKEKKLFLIYSTDIRGVNEWMGQLCSLINIHNLLSANLETEQNLNCTAILIHLAGILSTRSLNSINRQGMSFPNSILQKSTFENVKRFLSNVHGSDNLSSFVSSTIACVPHKTGTNAFDLLYS